jgi:mono/diheme cytochrome c family protein
MKTLSKLGFLMIALLVTILFIEQSCKPAPPKNSRLAQAQAGKAIFNEQCAPCHGSKEVKASVDTLKTTPKDLTKIIKSRGLTEFPIAEIARIIDGRLLVKAHGPREMPVWGEIYEAQGLDDEQIRGRKGELVAYLMSIQEQ